MPQNKSDPTSSSSFL